MKCKRCGTELKNDDEFCYRCGQRTTVFQRLFASKAIVGSTVAVMIVAVAAVLAYFIWTGKISSPFRGSQDNGPAVVKDDAPDEKEDKEPKPTQEETTATPEPTATAEPAVFKPANVTKQMKRELKPLLKRARPFLAFSAPHYVRRPQSFRWNDATVTTMAIYNLQYADEKVKYGDKYSSVKKKAKKEIEQLFGDYYKYEFVDGGTFPDYVYRRVNDTVRYNAERIFGRTYQLKMEKVIEYKEELYRVIVSAWIASQTNPNNKSAVQKYTLYVEPNETGKYGYTIRKVKLYQKKHGKVK